MNDDHGLVCSECGNCCRDDHVACWSCGHCTNVHHWYGGYCAATIGGLLSCACVLTPDQAWIEGQPRWPDDDEAVA